MESIFHRRMKEPKTDSSKDHPTFSNDEVGIFESLAEALVSLRAEIAGRWLEVQEVFTKLNDSKRASARNLIHYLALRRHDIRTLQRDLARHGISSLGRSESHVMSNLDTVLKLVYTVLRRTNPVPKEGDCPITLDEGNLILAERTQMLLGPPPEDRKVRVMVTLPSDASDDYELVRDLIEAGMDCARINSAHDSKDVWKRMVANVVRARSETGRNCRICFDIPGPKVRTGAFAPGPQVLKWSPARDRLGRVTRPARIWLTACEDPDTRRRDASAQLRLPRNFITHLQLGTKVKFRDARGSARSLEVVEIEADGIWLEGKKTSFVVPRTEFRIARFRTSEPISARPGPLPPLEQYALLRIGDPLILTRSQHLSTPESRTPDGRIVAPARIACTLPAVLDDIQIGESVWFDDGKIRGSVASVSNDRIEIRITAAGPNGTKLKGDRGINLPETRLTLPALTEADREVLRFAVEHAEIVGYSFVRSSQDVIELQSALKAVNAEGVGIVLKIETRDAFENLPDILLTSLRSSSVGVMIARGDLAVESGFERLAEVQEEILWMCEAAHIPVIWATQVLEQLSKKGISSRAEITDAAMSERAECVMLNKGPYVVEAVRALDDILQRMQSHLNKKSAVMRPLKLAKRFFDGEESLNGSVRHFDNSV